MQPVSKQESDPLKWWKEHSAGLPDLQKLAKRILCIPATSTPSERVFSTMGIIISKLRNRLSPSTAEAILFLKKNDYSSYKDTDTDDI